MKIAYVDIYGSAYEHDGCFDAEKCTIGQNLLLPMILLRNNLYSMGHEFHTLDMYSNDDTIDCFVFQNVPDSSLTCDGLEKVKYYIKNIFYRVKNGKSRADNMKLVIEKYQSSQKILIMQEPPVVSEKSYEKRFHDYFDKILTWQDDLVDEKRYIKFYYPQPKPEQISHIPYDKKHLLTMIAGNKCSNYPGELYSERYKDISFFESGNYDFDLYGIGWEKCNFKTYKGRVSDKLKTLSNYKYSICYENMSGIKGYVTEKIFDCFFAGVIPIYWGADNIVDYIPKDCFIDRRNFSDINEVYNYISSISPEEYDLYERNIKSYLDSDSFNNSFSVDSYVKRMTKIITDCE